MSVPTGSSPETFKEYYEYLFREFYMKANGGVTWEWLSLQANLRYILIWAGWLFVVAVGLFMLNRRQGRTRFKDDIYPQEHYNGYIQERVGPSGIIKWVWIGVLLWTLFLTVQQILIGQAY